MYFWPFFCFLCSLSQHPTPFLFLCFKAIVCYSAFIHQHLLWVMWVGWQEHLLYLSFLFSNNHPKMESCSNLLMETVCARFRVASLGTDIFDRSFVNSFLNWKSPFSSHWAFHRKVISVWSQLHLRGQTYHILPELNWIEITAVHTVAVQVVLSVSPLYKNLYSCKPGGTFLTFPHSCVSYISRKPPLNYRGK